MQKKYNIIPINVIGYLADIHKNYKENCLDKKDWEIADEICFMLNKAYHIYIGSKKDYRKKLKGERQRIISQIHEEVKQEFLQRLPECKGCEYTKTHKEDKELAEFLHNKISREHFFSDENVV
jgi:hypothetical protein